jgi:hypothetical protein
MSGVNSIVLSSAVILKGYFYAYFSKYPTSNSKHITRSFCSPQII